MAFFNIKLAQDVAAKGRHRAMSLQGLSLFVCCKSLGTLLFYCKSSSEFRLNAHLLCSRELSLFMLQALSSKCNALQRQRLPNVIHLTALGCRVCVCSLRENKVDFEYFSRRKTTKLLHNFSAHRITTSRRKTTKLLDNFSAHHNFSAHLAPRQQLPEHHRTLRIRQTQSSFIHHVFPPQPAAGVFPLSPSHTIRDFLLSLHKPLHSTHHGLYSLSLQAPAFRHRLLYYRNHGLYVHSCIRILCCCCCSCCCCLELLKSNSFSSHDCSDPGSVAQMASYTSSTPCI